MQLLRLLLVLPRQRLPLLLVILPSHPDISEQDDIGRDGRRDAPDSGGSCTLLALPYVVYILCCEQLPPSGESIIPPKSTVTKYMPMGVVIIAAVKPRSL